MNINSGQFLEKQDIEHKKQDIEQENIDKTGFSSKTKKHIEQLSQTLGAAVFSRSEVLNILPLSASAASELLRKMLEIGVIEKVAGQGKGKYRFR
ncbi:MAG: hypothetical protein SOW21_11570 [[Actinobacillus] rossii]|uniref:Transcriptional regulator n=1 Tax=[Actinobacillus] rossii TaxID=123820 RepID=A0A380U196_9PAST|nr:hypothetical protein [[Actinobacillus] rossii]MDY3124972.1 hypothetical protein [[Actinobacillus] rossii]MDY4505404.1 hypothetical protein [[Actinobacillus] rossii]SUT94818.1 Uncharacterised protein [[Actinobacillus] rossii]